MHVHFSNFAMHEKNFQEFIPLAKENNVFTWHTKYAGCLKENFINTNQQCIQEADKHPKYATLTIRIR